MTHNIQDDETPPQTGVNAFEDINDGIGSHKSMPFSEDSDLTRYRDYVDEEQRQFSPNGVSDRIRNLSSPQKTSDLDKSPTVGDADTSVQSPTANPSSSSSPSSFSESRSHPSDVIESQEEQEMDPLGKDIETWIQGGGISRNLSQLLSSEKVIVRLKRKRNENLEFQEFYIPEKRRKIDSLIQSLTSLQIGENKRDESDLDSPAVKPKPEIESSSSTGKKIDSTTTDEAPASTSGDEKSPKSTSKGEDESQVLEDKTTTSDSSKVKESKTDDPDSAKALSSNQESKSSNYSFGKYRLLRQGVSLRQSYQPTKEDIMRGKREEMTKKLLEKRLVKIQELRENNLKVIDIGFEGDTETTDPQDIVYDIFVKEGVIHERPKNKLTPIVESFDEQLLNDDDIEDEYDTEDSNAENNPLNDYGYVSDSEEDEDQEPYPMPGEEYNSEDSISENDSIEDGDGYGADAGFGGSDSDDMDLDEYHPSTNQRTQRSTHHYAEFSDDDDFSGQGKNSRKKSSVFNRYDEDEDEGTDDEELQDFLNEINQDSMRDN